MPVGGEVEFIQDFKKTDFSKKTYFELIEYIIIWKKRISDYTKTG